MAKSLTHIGRGKTAVSASELTKDDSDWDAMRSQLESLHRKGFGYLESKDVCAECSSDKIAGVCTRSYLHEGSRRIERFCPNGAIIGPAISSWMLECLSDLGWTVGRDETAQSAQVDYVLNKDAVVATLNIHTNQLDFAGLMADVGKSKESEVNAIFIVIFAFGIPSSSAATYVSTHPEVVFFQASDLPELKERLRAFDAGIEERLNSINLSRHLIRKYEGTDFRAPVEQLLDRWSDILSELPSLACQDLLMVKKYGTPSKVGSVFETNCASLLGSLFRVVRLGGKGQPDGIIVIPSQADAKPGLLLYECKSTKDQPYSLGSRDKRQIVDYLKTFRREEAREVYNILGIILISSEFDETDCIEKQRSLEKSLRKGETVSFLPISSLLKLGERYVKMLPGIRLRLEYDYSSVRELLSSRGIVDSANIDVFLEGIRDKESRIERDIRYLLT